VFIGVRIATQAIMKAGIFCTIVTPNYLHFAVRLFQSLKEHADRVAPELYVFLVDAVSEEDVQKVSDFAGAGFTVVPLSALCAATDRAVETFKTYGGERGGMLRWALKPVALEYVLARAPYAYFLDPDLCFFSRYDFLWDYFESSDVVLSPHWREIDPSKSEGTSAISLNYKHGIFNGGFVGASRRGGMEFLAWWSASCLALPVFDNIKHTHDDQKFLDVVPVYFEKVKVLKHWGCNISEWNERYLPRFQRDGKVYVKGETPLVFAHFSSSYEWASRDGRDKIMVPFYLTWKQELLGIKETLCKMGLEGFWLEESKKPGIVKRGFSPKTWIYQWAKYIVERAEK
jgi:hypothetical protein